MTRPMLLPALLGALLSLLPGGASRAQELAVLRPVAVVEDPVLRLGDLFDGISPTRAAAPIGAAPAPGRRLLLEPAQLAALARAHGLVWRPLSVQERAVVERPGRPVPRAEIEAALRAELVPLGFDPEAALELGGVILPMVPPAAPVTLAVEGMGLDPAGGRFAATLMVVAEGMPALRQRVAGRAVATLPAVLATRRMALGEVVRAGDVRAIRLRADHARPGIAQGTEQVVGQQLRRPIGAEQPFALADLGAPVLVEKNALVTLQAEGPGLQLAAQGRALEAAARGAVVSVVNLSSRMVVEGVVTGPGQVRVILGATPGGPGATSVADRH